MTRINTNATNNSNERARDRKKRADAAADASQQEQMRTRLAEARAAQAKHQACVQSRLRIHRHGVLIANHGAEAAARALAAIKQAEAAAGDSNPQTRFDSVDSRMPGGFFDDFTDSGGQGQGQGQDQGDGMPQLSDIFGAGMQDDMLDMSELAALLPTDANNGVFELLLPSGENLGVVVNAQSSALSYLLSPSSDQLASKLRRGRMELEDKLGRLTHRNVNITVL